MSISAPDSEESTGNSGTPILGLDDHEEQLVREVLAYLESRHCEDIEAARTRISCLRDLGQVISRYPSIRESQMVRGEMRDEEKLIETIRAFAHPSRLLHSPTRIVAIRSYMVAKSHAFTMLAILVQDKLEFYVPVRRIIFSIICTLMIEEVYFSCLNDSSFSEKIRFSLADDLVTLWDSGVDPRAIEHLPALEALWAARDAAPPSFGTMDGASELVRISGDLGDDWHKFLVNNIAGDETLQALEEFLFGLSYEEILEVRSRLIRFGISAVNNDEVRSYLGSNPAYTIVNDADPRSIYDFYVDRRDAAQLRKRINAPGPKRTLEEIYLKHRLAKDE
ncbi:conserved hypothetical protein [Treponema primitia ZAS-2]|uniref:Uncharacterized protein n=1 Tax=Treponema primitia (strain ATCC BAA-887 / DSM 12427 / ZAS-2) TaxID=545694 RepID=F5YH26_TREPZ|nr:hypothetical protein [Treponema primitia]AEF85763.1 conserved hypothetical protein [Treponema primitia ZAS-2]